MSSFQNMKFGSVEEFLDFLPENERVIVDFLREIVLEAIPEAKEKLSYNVPYYWRHSRVVFIWPAAVPWGKVKLNGVQIGFCNGNKLDDSAGWLDRGNRKQVFTKVFMDVSEIDVDLLRAYIFDAVAVDEELKKRKMKK